MEVDCTHRVCPWGLYHLSNRVFVCTSYPWLPWLACSWMLTWALVHLPPSSLNATCRTALNWPETTLCWMNLTGWKQTHSNVKRSGCLYKSWWIWAILYYPCQFPNCPLTLTTVCWFKVSCVKRSLVLRMSHRHSQTCSWMVSGVFHKVQCHCYMISCLWNLYTCIAEQKWSLLYCFWMQKFTLHWIHQIFSCLQTQHHLISQIYYHDLWSHFRLLFWIRLDPL